MSDPTDSIEEKRLLRDLISSLLSWTWEETISEMKDCSLSSSCCFFFCRNRNRDWTFLLIRIRVCRSRQDLKNTSEDTRRQTWISYSSSFLPWTEELTAPFHVFLPFYGCNVDFPAASASSSSSHFPFDSFICLLCISRKRQYFAISSVCSFENESDENQGNKVGNERNQWERRGGKLDVLDNINWMRNNKFKTCKRFVKKKHENPGWWYFWWWTWLAHDPYSSYSLDQESQVKHEWNQEIFLCTRPRRDGQNKSVPRKMISIPCFFLFSEQKWTPKFWTNQRLDFCWFYSTK